MAEGIRLSPTEFEVQAAELVELLRPSGLGWQWMGGPVGPGYMRAHTTVPALDGCPHCARAVERDAALESAVDARALHAEAEDACARRSWPPLAIGEREHSLQYHILLHPTYCQPTLLILGAHCDGSALRTSDVWVHMGSGLQAHRDSPFVLTEVEHPSLGVPCFALHPCRTGDLMSSLMSAPPAPAAGADGPSAQSRARRSYLTAWWSAIAPVVNLPNHLSWYYTDEGRR